MGKKLVFTGMLLKNIFKDGKLICNNNDGSSIYLMFRWKITLRSVNGN